MLVSRGTSDGGDDKRLFLSIKDVRRVYTDNTLMGKSISKLHPLTHNTPHRKTLSLPIGFLRPTPYHEQYIKLTPFFLKDAIYSGNVYIPPPYAIASKSKIIYESSLKNICFMHCAYQYALSFIRIGAFLPASSFQIM